MNASTKKAPGASTKILAGSYHVPSGSLNNSVEPVENTVPLPKNSLMAPRIVSVIVKPIPTPIPSKNESKGPFLAAYDSALPKIIQLTTISGIKIPSDSYKSCTYCCMNN